MFEASPLHQAAIRLMNILCLQEKESGKDNVEELTIQSKVFNINVLSILMNENQYPLF